MASEAISALGTLLQVSDGSATPVYATIAEVKSIDGPGLTADTLETTTHSSTGAWKEFITGLLDGGELSFDINFVPTSAGHDAETGLLKAFTSRQRTGFKLVFPDEDATTWAFDGLVTGFSVSAPTDDFLGASVTVKVTGAPNLTGTP